ncbi:hypothetical protein Tco_0474978 [Tanacetum coccineum]
MGTIDDMKSSLTQSALDALCEKFHIPQTVHPDLPGRNQRIRNSPTGKICLSVIAAAKVSHFEILCPVHGFAPTVGNFCKFYINSKNKGWMSFSKRSDTAQVDSSAFPLSIPWHNNKTLKKDPHPTPTEFNAEVCDFHATHHAPFRKFPESFLCLVGISLYYELDDNVYPDFLIDDVEEMDLFAFINHADPTKVRIVKKQIEEGQVPLLESTRGRVVPLVGVNDQGDQNDDMRKKRKAASRASGSVLPPKRLREDHGTSEDVGASTVGKSLDALQGLLDSSTLAVEVGVTVTATMPFVTSSMTPTPEREGGRHTDSVSEADLQTRHPAKRFVISSDSSHDSNSNAADDEVTSIVRSPVLDPPIMTTTVATIVVVDTSSVLVPRAGYEPAHHTLFGDFASIGEARPDIAGPSYPAGTELLTNSFYVSQEMDSETLHQTYVPKWNVTNDFALDDPDVCRSVIDHLAPPLSLKEAEAAEAIRLRGHISVAEATEAARVNELKSLAEQNLALEEEKTVLDGKVTALHSCGCR